MTKRAPRNLLVTALTCAAGLLAAAVPAHAAEKGVVSDLTWELSTQDKQRSVAALTDLGAGWVHMEIKWTDAEPSDGTYDEQVLDDFEEALTLARQAGLKVVVVVARSPAWSRPSTSTRDVEPPSDPQDLADFMGYVAGRYAGQVDAWEVWNEPNHRYYWYWDTQDPADYVPLLKASYTAIKAADPSTKVLIGGLAFNDYPWLEGAYAAEPNLGNYFDVVSLHPYTYTAPPEAIERNGDGRMTKESFPAYREVRKTLVDHGDSDKPIWLTEIGWSKCSKPPQWCLDSEATVADYLTRAYRLIEQDPYVQVGLWYMLRNSWWAHDADTWEEQLGLMRTDFSPKPSYFAFRNYGAAGSTGSAGLSSGSTGSTSAAGALRAPTSITLRARRLRSAGSAGVRSRRPVRRLRIFGRVTNADAGTVVVELQRRRHRRWRRALRRRVRISSTGRFKRKLRTRGAGRWRVRARYVGTARYAPSKSRFLYFRVRKPRAR
jgi:hypothetical protein